MRFLTLLLLMGSTAAAQDSSMVGARVRERSAPTRVGHLLSLSVDSAMVKFGDEPASALVRSRLEIASSARRRTSEGAVVGAVALGALGFRLGSRNFGRLCEGSPSAGFTCNNDRSMAPPLTVVGGLLGAGIGALMGHQIKSERWVPLVFRP